MADAIPGMAGDRAPASRPRRGLLRMDQVRRLMAMAGNAQPLQVGGSSSQGGRRRNDPEEDGADKRSLRDRSDGPPPSPTPFGTPGDETPAFGCVSLSGRTCDIEDAVSLKPGFFCPRPVGASPMHFFAVFDGHGGSHVAKMCKEWMHVVLAEELRRAEAESEDGEVTVDAIGAALDRSFSIVDELVLSSCTCGSVGGTCDCEEQGMATGIVGSTAMLALFDRHRVFVANCGDCRAVLARGGRACALSEDHRVGGIIRNFTQLDAFLLGLYGWEPTMAARAAGSATWGLDFEGCTASSGNSNDVVASFCHISFRSMSPFGFKAGPAWVCATTPASPDSHGVAPRVLNWTQATTAILRFPADWPPRGLRISVPGMGWYRCGGEISSG